MRRGPYFEEPTDLEVMYAWLERYGCELTEMQDGKLFVWTDEHGDELSSERCHHDAAAIAYRATGGKSKRECEQDAAEEAYEARREDARLGY